GGAVPRLRSGGLDHRHHAARGRRSASSRPPQLPRNPLQSPTHPIGEAHMPKDLRTFISQVEETFPHSYLRTSHEVDPRFELTGVLRKFQDQGQFPMVMFENVKDCDVPVLGNALGSRDRLALLFDSDSKGLAHAYEKRQGTMIPPEHVDTGPVKE